ncbi:Necrosis inducing protein [Phytophthora cactorum]|nr:Necrosis inducing protein [Phytophthora cactorum]
MKLRALLLLVTALAAVNADWIDHDQYSLLCSLSPSQFRRRPLSSSNLNFNHEWMSSVSRSQRCWRHRWRSQTHGTPKWIMQRVWLRLAGLRALYMVQRRLGHYVLVVFPERFAIASLGHRHDWENVVIWISNPDIPDPVILAVCPSAHGGYSRYAPPNADTIDGTSAK